MAKNLSLTQFGYLVALDEAGNFGMAARRCGITQPTLSMQIQKLEEEIGLSVFDRSAQPVVATEIGRKIIDQARRVLKEARQIEEIAMQEKGEVVGEFRLGVIPTLSPYLLPLFLRPFTEAYPQVQLTLDESQTDQILDKLKREELDAGLLVTPLGNKSFQETPLFYEPFWVYVSEDHPLSRAKTIDGRNLSLSDFWLLKEGHCFREQVVQLCKKHSEQSHLPIRFEGGSLEALKALVDQNFGVTLLPDLAVRRIPKREAQLKVRAFSKPVPVREVSCVQTRLFAKKRIADALMKTIRSSVPKELLKKASPYVVGLGMLLAALFPMPSRAADAFDVLLMWSQLKARVGGYRMERVSVNQGDEPSCVLSVLKHASLSASARPVLMIHGFGDNKYSFEPYFEGRTDLIAIDWPRHGASSCDWVKDLPKAAEMIDRAYRALQVEHKIALPRLIVGASLGVPLSGLVSVAGPKTRYLWLAPPLLNDAALDELIAYLKGVDSVEESRAYMNRVFTRKKDYPDFVFEAVLKRRDQAIVFLDEIDAKSIKARLLEKDPSKVELLIGANDELVPRESFDQAFVRRFGAQMRLLADCGHDLQRACARNVKSHLN